MADAGLKIVIGADISKGVAGLNDVNKALSATGAASAKAGEAFNKISAKSGAAGAAVLDFSRIVQDAPFALNNFGSIANNIDPAVGSFTRLGQEARRLSEETGRTVTSFSLLKQSLLGGAGIGLAISTVTSIITAAQMKYGSLGNAIDALTSSTSAAASAQRDISKAFAEAQGAAAGEISNINALLSVARNETLSKEARAEAINKLNQEYDAYLPKLTQENINTQAVTAAVDKLNASLIRQAKIKGLQDLISKDTAKQAELFAGSLGDNASAWDNIVAAIKSAGPTGNFFFEQQLAGARRTGVEYDKAQKRIDAFNKFLKQLTTEEAVAGTLFDETKLKHGEDLLKKQLSAIEKIRDAAKEFQGKLFDLKDIDEATDRLAKLETQVGDLKLQIAVRDAKKAGLPASEIEKLKEAIKQDTQKRLNEAFEKEALLLEFKNLKLSPIERLDVNEIASKVFTNKEKIILTLGENGVDVRMKKEAVDVSDLQGKIAKATGLDKKIPVITLHEARVLVNGEKITAQIEGKEQILADLNRQVAAIFEGGLNDGFAAIGEGFGEALATGDFGEGLKKAAQNILGILGDVMQQIGKAVIAAAIKIELLKKTLETWAFKNPALAIVAGVGLIAAGAALKNIQFDGPKFAEGGIVSGPMIGQVGERFRPEVILPLDRLPQLFKQIGGDFDGGMQLIPIINNEGLYLAMKRGERSAGRKF